MKMRGARILLEALRCEGTKHVFGYPGGAVLHIYDEIVKTSEELGITHYLVRHEQHSSNEILDPSPDVPDHADGLRAREQGDGGGTACASRGYVLHASRGGRDSSDIRDTGHRSAAFGRARCPLKLAASNGIQSGGETCAWRNATPSA